MCGLALLEGEGEGEGGWWPGTKSDDYKAITMEWLGSPPERAVKKREEKSDTPYHQQTALTDY